MECKANLEFNLPAQEVDFNVAVAGLDLALFILEFKQEVRSKAKYGQLKEGEVLSWYDFYDFLNESVSGSGINDLINSIP